MQITILRKRKTKKVRKRVHDSYFFDILQIWKEMLKRELLIYNVGNNNVANDTKQLNLLPHKPK